MPVQGGGGLLDPDPSVADALLAKVGRKGNNVVVKEWDEKPVLGERICPTNGYEQETKFYAAIRR
jgi:hypothetical protein